ncbi:hypothetical protein BJY00DRAFT_275972 [Aspergillus carlsbadensis]|nr:hypothetical protein BJY00DRAFT_275972 [Aspergillus carlsbadensis]
MIRKQRIPSRVEATCDCCNILDPEDSRKDCSTSITFHHTPSIAQTPELTRTYVCT